MPQPGMTLEQRVRLSVEFLFVGAFLVPFQVYINDLDDDLLDLSQ